MICLGIESTAHTLGIGICKNGEILANARSMYKSAKPGEGIIPRKAAEHHSEIFPTLYKQALAQAKLTPDKIGLYAFSEGPGIGACLRTACAAAKYLSAKHRKPIIGVNHCHSHIEIAKKFTGFKDPLTLYVSGGNTQILVEEKKSFHVLGETLDIGVGNLFDSFARELGLQFAHGSAIEQLALKGKYTELPYTVKGMNLAFSGLFTAVSKKIPSTSKEDLCYSLQETVYAMLCEASERALTLTGKREVMVCGGVAQNKRLQQMMGEMAKEHGAKFGVAPNEFNADNGAMIAYTGEILFSRGIRSKLKDCRPRQKYRSDEVRLRL
ncbi:tRNA N6-adenosine threonylcarbamoyltransferase [Candidatus Gugararchaeum adminiculabundum]|nr:tRNA N6-adenosine threonylcarbamoyltransferase [Candidatus Gugararchaeum adminiculabundum]